MYFPDLSGNFSCAQQAGTAEPGQAGSLDGFSTIHPFGVHRTHQQRGWIE
jgi:hypothetical protein